MFSQLKSSRRALTIWSVWNDATSGWMILRSVLTPAHQEGEAGLGVQSLLCPIRVSKPTASTAIPNALLSRWVVDVMQQAFMKAGRPTPAGVHAGYTQPPGCMSGPYTATRVVVATSVWPPQVSLGGDHIS